MESLIKKINSPLLKNKKIVFGGAILVLVIVYFCIHIFSNVTVHGPTSPVLVPDVSPLPDNGDALNEQDLVAYNERSAWKSLYVGNQKQLKTTQRFSLPAGWVIREDYLFTIFPPTLESKMKNHRALIMRPNKKTSHEDAIFTVVDTSSILEKSLSEYQAAGEYLLRGN